jgi:acetylornithine aminotransferase/acetylornithine/N-succinyldiaminopimelate aminotransferase
MAKSLGGGFPMGAFWVRDKYADLLGAGTHSTTYGGGPLGCAVALKIFEVIERDHLAKNARSMGEFLQVELQRLLLKYPQLLKSVRGLGLMLGFELVEKEKIPAFANDDKFASIQFVNRLHEAGLLTVPSGASVVRMLPALNLTRAQAEEGIGLVEGVLKALAF